MTDTVINITLSALLPGLWNIVLVVAPFGAMQVCLGQKVMDAETNHYLSHISSGSLMQRFASLRLGKTSSFYSTNCQKKLLLMEKNTIF